MNEMKETMKDFVIEKGILKRYTGSGGNVSIPEGVVYIEIKAFNGCTGLTGITIPESVKSIGKNAFEGCTGLTDITVPEGVTFIKRHTFKDCTGLTRVDLPASVTNIDSSAFEGCKSLADIRVDARNAVYGSWDGMLLHKSGKEWIDLLYCPRGRAGEVSIPEGVTEIVSNAFHECCNLTGVTIPASVTEANPGSNFDYCWNLTDIRVAARNRTYLMMNGMLVKREQDGLTLVRCPVAREGWLSVPQGITKIGEGAFWGCKYLTFIRIPGSVTEIGSGAFWACARMREIRIPEGVTEIGFSYRRLRCSGVHRDSGKTFTRCYTLEDVYLPNSVTEIAPNMISRRVKIHAPAGSYAQRYAKANGHDFDPM